MAQKRMFSLSVVDTDNFLEMPISSRLLYYELGMRADDDGFVDNWKKIMTFTGLKEDDMKVLIAKKFILPFESGVIVIRHWRMNNYLQKDRIKPTIYQEELKQLSLDNNNVYTLDTDCIHSIDKNSIDKNSIDKNSLVITTTNNTIYKYIEENFGRTISPVETEKINDWLSLYETEIIKYAIQIATLNNKRTFNYVNGILKNWKTAGYKTLQEIKDNETNKELSEKEQKELDEILDYNWIEDSEVYDD